MNLIEHLQQISDFRRTQGLRYPLRAVLLMTIMSIMSGRCRYREIAAFAKANQKELLKFLQLKKRKRLPSHVSFRTILKGINFDEVLTAFNCWAAQYVTREDEEWTSLDGKALASTVTDYASSYQNFVSLVSLFSHKRGQVLRVAKLENQKESEIPTVQELIEALDLTGVVFTLDALHCQKKTVETIINSHNDYVIQVKRNQPTLFQSIIKAFESQPPLSSVTSHEQSRGRHEQRTVSILGPPEEMVHAWKGLQRIIHVVRQGSRKGQDFLAHH